MNHFWEHPIPSAVNAGSDRTNDERATYQQHPKYPGPAPTNTNSYDDPRHQQHSSTTAQTNAGWDRPGSSSQNWHSTEPETEEDPDGLPYEPDQEDPELTRKRKELQGIEERIMLKRASLALKTAESKTYKPGPSTKKSKRKKPLRDRITCVLQLRDRVLRTNGSLFTSRRSSFHVQHDHPLKQRVAAALQQRPVNPPLEPQEYEPVPFVSSPAPQQKDPSPAKEEVNNSDQGFMRFLNILNKGVDIDKLTKIVNDDTEGMPHSSQNGVQTHSETSLFEPPPIERVKLEDEEKQPSTNEQQKHLQNILDSLGLSLGTDEISRLGDRTQERLYGKKQSTQEDKTQTDQPQAESEEKYSPAHYTRSSPSSESDSRSSRALSRTPSPPRRRRSPSPRRSRRRSSWSPRSRRERHSRSPSPRRRDSRSPRRRESPHPRDHQDSHLNYLSPMQPYPYPPSQYFTPHYLPQMYPNAYCYSQYTAYYNHWAYNQASVMASAGLSNQSYLQNILPLLSGLQASPNTSKQESRTKTNARCLINIESNGVVPCRKTMTREQKTQMNRHNKAYRKCKRKKERENKNHTWETELNDVITRIKSAQDPAGVETAGSSSAQDTSGAQQNPTDSSGPKKKKKKTKVFIERNEEMEKLLKERPGPVTRNLGLKNPAKLSEHEGQLVEIQDVEVPPQDQLEELPVIGPVERTDRKVSEGETVERQPKPELTVERQPKPELTVERQPKPQLTDAEVEVKLNKMKRARRNAELKWRRSMLEADHESFKKTLRMFKQVVREAKKRGLKKGEDLPHEPTPEPTPAPVEKTTPAPVERTEGEADEEQPTAKPELTEAEVKAKLRKELEAFNSRMKKSVTKPASMPQNIKEEDEI